MPPVEIAEEVLVKDPGSPSGPREEVPARLDGKGVEIKGEDGNWYVVKPVGLGKRIIQAVVSALYIRHMGGQ